MKFLFYVAALFQLVSAVGLITIVALQTSKSEGLGGTLGGKSTSSFRGRPGLDEQLQNYTTYLAVAFLVLSLVVSVFYLRHLF